MPQSIVLVQRVGHFLHFETFALVGNLNCKPAIACVGPYVNLLIPVIAVSVHYRIDHAFSHSHSDTMLLVLVEARFAGRAKNLFLGMIHAFQGGGVLTIKQYFRTGFHSFSIRRQPNERA